MINVSDEGNNSEIIATYILKELDYEILYSAGLEKRKMVMGLEYVPQNDKEIVSHYRKIVGKLERVERESKEAWKKREQELLKENPDMIFRHPSTVSKFKLFIEYVFHKKSWNKSCIGDILCRKEGIDYLFDAKLKLFQENKNLNLFGVTDNEVLNYDHLTKSGKVAVKILINLKKYDGYYYGIFDWKDFTYSKNYDPHKSKQTAIRLKDGLDVSKLTKFENVRNYKFEQYVDLSKIKRKKEWIKNLDDEGEHFGYVYSWKSKKNERNTED